MQLLPDRGRWRRWLLVGGHQQLLNGFPDLRLRGCVSYLADCLLVRQIDAVADHLEQGGKIALHVPAQLTFPLGVDHCRQGHQNRDRRRNFQPVGRTVTQANHAPPSIGIGNSLPGTSGHFYGIGCPSRCFKNRRRTAYPTLQVRKICASSNNLKNSIY